MHLGRPELLATPTGSPSPAARAGVSGVAAKIVRVQGLKRKLFYVISFELIAIVLASTLLRVFSDSTVATAGITAAASSALAMGWNYIYNILFEAWEARQERKGRSVLRRVVHALGFEAGLVTMLVPLFAWLMGVGLVAALLLNALMIAFFLVYAFLFNLVFDRVFGLPLAAQGR